MPGAAAGSTSGRRAPTGSSMTDGQPARPRRRSRPRSTLLAEIDAYARGKDSRVKQVMASLSGDWQAVQILRGDGARAADIRPLVRLNVSVVVEADGRMETGSHGTGGRIAYDTFLDPAHWQASVDEALRQALVNLDVDARPGRRDGGGAGPGLARHPAARGDRPRAGRRLQPQEDLGLRRPDGPARRRAGRDRGRRRHHRPTAAARSPSTTRARRPSRTDADRGRHPGRLPAGPPERPPDGHEAHRQRPAPELRPSSDAAHDQHHHAGRQPRPGGDHRLGEEGPLCGEFRRRPGRHHLRQVRLLRHRGLPDRGRQDRRRR